MIVTQRYRSVNVVTNGVGVRGVAAGFAGAWDRVRSVSTLVDVLRGDEDVGDVIELTGPEAACWTEGLGVPAGWQLARIDPAALGVTVAPARIATYGPAGSTAPVVAVETLHVFGFTGSASFREVLSNAACTFTDLGGTDVHTEVLPIPVRCGSAAIRSSAAFSVGGQAMWGQQGNYLAGSQRPHAGRLIVHGIYVAAGAPDPILTDDVAALMEAVYAEFVAALPTIPVS